MNFDCFAFVGAQRNTLLTRAATTSVERILQDLTALRQKDVSEPVFVLRSYTNDQGDEVATELYTDAALTALSKAPATPMSKVEILHANKPAFFASPTAGEAYSPAGYTCQAVMLAPKEGGLDHAYHYSQNLEHAWNPGVRSRSSSVGDVFIVDGEAYMVASIGFTSIVFSPDGKEVGTD